MDLSKISTTPSKDLSKDKIKKETKKLQEELLELQSKMYAQGKYSLLIVLQGMDASGKDGSVRNVFKKVPPYGISVSSFKVPTKEELAHDFLWRVHQETPKKGQIKVFNRSHYEDVLVTRVLGLIDDEIAEERFELINSFEKMIAHNNTRILKFYLHVSHEQQEVRLKERMENPEKHWKHSDGDWEMRKHWDSFRNYYEECLEKCNVFPWDIIPVDKNWYKEYLITKRVVEELRELDLSYPDLESEL